MQGLIPAILGGVVCFGLGAIVNRWLRVSRRSWLTSWLAVSVLLAAVIYWANRPE